MDATGSNRPDLPRWITFAVGLALTFVFFSGYRPWGPGPIDAVLVLGPVLLAIGAAGLMARPGQPARPGRAGSPARRVVRIGLAMLLVGGCPWIYTPLFTGGESNQASGMLGTVLFLLVGLPGLAFTAVGLGQVSSDRRAARAAGQAPDRAAGAE